MRGEKGFAYVILFLRGGFERRSLSGSFALSGRHRGDFERQSLSILLSCAELG